MKLPTMSLCRGALLFVSVLTIWVGIAPGQEKSSAPSRSGVQAAKKSPQTKSQAPPKESALPAEQSSAAEEWNDGDSPELIRKREEWFYKQRSSVSGHIPAGARFKAFQHMQRMMEAEGKLVRQPDGSYAAATPQAGPPVGGAWSSLGPTPTTGGFFSQVSGRIEAIAVDSSDPSGNTVLIGGAQGGIWRSTDGGSTWTPVGDQNPSLAMGSIAFANPSNPGGAGVVYAGTGEQASIGFDVYYGAGVLKSTDGGLHWAQTCTVASTTCPFIGPYSDFTFGFYSDGGARISYVAVNPSNPSLVLAAAHIPQAGGSLTAGGVYCSDDAGAHWSSIPTASGEMATFVGFANATTAYAALGRTSGTLSGAVNPNGIYKSTNADGGSTKKCGTITFSNVTTNGVAGVPAADFGRIDLGIAAFDTTGNTVFASIADATLNPITQVSHASRNNLGVFKTSDGGNSWINTNAPDICSPQCWYDNVIKVDPTNSGIVFFGGGAHSAVNSTSVTFEWVIHSIDGGATWSPAIPTTSGDPTLPHVDQHALSFFKLPTGKVRLYLGNDGGLWRADDAEAPTVTWMNLNQNLTLTQFYPNLSVNPSDLTIAFGGAQDNGSQIFQGNPNWTNDGHCGDGGQTAVDFQVPTSVYITCQLISLFFSPSGGTDPTSYVRIGSGINPNGTDSVDFIPPIATDPSTPGRVYFGTDHVYQSSDNGTTFTAISGVLPTRAGNYLTAFGVSPNKPAVVYAGANGGDIFVATNVAPGSASFFQVAGQSQHPVRNVTALAVDPHDPTGNTVYAAFSGFAVSGQDTLGHVFVSMNGGAGWADVSCTNLGACQTPNAADLPNIPVNDLVVDPDLPGTIYAATDIGVFQGTCAGTACTWNTLGTGLPNVSVLSLKLHEPSRTLIAGTHGRGAWSLVLTNFPFPPGPHITSLSPFSAPASAASPLTLTVNGTGLTGGTVQWKAGGTTTPLATMVVSDSQVTATVPVSLLTSGGTVQVSVSVGPANSNSLTFVVPSAPPTISSVSPNNTPININSPDIPVIVTGTNFSASSQVMLNPDFTATNAQPHGQVVIPTTFKSPTQLSATIPGSFITGTGSINSVGVRTLPPGGGITLSPPAGPTPLPTFTVVAPPPANDNFASAMPFNSLGGQLIVDSSAATMQSTDPILPCVTQHAGGSGKNGSYNTVWFSFTPSSNGTITDLSTQFSNYDTTLAVFTGTMGNLTMVPGACNDDINPGVVIQSDLQNISVTGGTTYYIMVGAFGPPDPNPVALGGYSNITLSFTQAPPDFTMTPVAPISVTVNAGSPATYTVAIGATGGFASSVTVTCSLPAAATTCAANPPSVAPGNSTTITVTTMAHQILIPARPLKRIGPWQRVVPLLVLAAVALILLVFAARTRRQRIAISIPLAGLVLFLVFQAAGCGGGNNSGPPPLHGTQPGPYTVTITGTSGATTHTTTVMLTVN